MYVMNPEPHSPPQKLTLGCPILDRLLRGGIPTRHVTELVSESGCGKTQLCLQLLLSSAAALYLHSEFPFPLRRLRQLASSSRSHISSSRNPLDRIFVQPVYTADHLFDVLLRLEPVLSNPRSNHFPIRLIVVDSIAALFRSEFDNTASDLKRRSSMFFKISGKLKSLANKFGLAIVLTNQVVDMMDSNEGVNNLRVGNMENLISSGRRVCPALGLSWASCVNSRIFLSMNEEVVRQNSSSGNSDVGREEEFVQTQKRRKLHVVFSPHLPESSCEFVILREGVFGIDTKDPLYLEA